MGKDLKGNPLPPGIMQRKSGIYRGRFYYKGETYTKDNADLKKLVQEMEDLRYEVKHGLKGKGDNITLDTWFDIWLNTHKKRTIKESTQVRYDDFYRRYIKKQIGKQRVADFNPIILERLLQNMADDDYSTKTIRDVYNILNAMFKYAVHNRILTFNPCAGVEVPKTKTKQIRVLTVKEQREVLEHAKERIHENQNLLLSGKLTAHLNQIDQEVTEQVEVLMKQMAEKQGVNENLKRKDQMKWVRLMNNIKVSAEEIVLKERVYM